MIHIVRARDKAWPNHVTIDLSVSFWCHDPGIGLNYLIDEGPRNLLITSDTLAPLKLLERELKTNFDVQLENTHVIDPSLQCLTVVLKKTINNLPLNLSNEKYGDNMTVKELGLCLVNCAKITPHGMLVLFASKSLMFQCLHIWSSSKKEKSIIARLEEGKSTFRDPKSRSQVKETIAQYTKLSKSKGAIFFAVCNSESLEDVEFTDEMARAVVLIGVPYPQLTEKRYTLLEDRSKNF